MPDAPIMTLKRAYVRLARREWPEAEMLAGRARRDFQRLGRSSLVHSANLVSAVVAARSSRWETVDSVLGGGAPGAADDLYVLELLARLCVQAGKVERSARALVAARAIAQAQHDHEAIDRIDELSLRAK
jgi:hypothetical protein